MSHWKCWQCGLKFLHARYLANHLMIAHGAPER